MTLPSAGTHESNKVAKISKFFVTFGVVYSFSNLWYDFRIEIVILPKDQLTIPPRLDPSTPKNNISSGV